MSTDAPIDVDALKGEALDQALDAGGLSKQGTADEKRDRLRAAIAEADLETLKDELGENPAVVRTAYPIDSFDSKVDGVPVIDSKGVVIPRDKLDAVKDAAESAQVRIEEV